MLLGVWGKTSRLCALAREHSSFTAIPIIDVGPLVCKESTAEDIRGVGQQLHKACSSVGFFYVKNHGALLVHTGCTRCAAILANAESPAQMSRRAYQLVDSMCMFVTGHLACVEVERWPE
jgi:non-haem dioxygenase in morphine synthesis N-terminal